MVCWVLWISPLGIASLISTSIMKACDLYQTLLGLGLWVLTVLLGLALFACIILPCMLWLVARTSPLKFMRTFSKALVMAFGTSSSSAALPVSSFAHDYHPSFTKTVPIRYFLSLLRHQAMLLLWH